MSGQTNTKDIFVSRESMLPWGKAVDDENNTIHYDSSVAREMGFADTPVHGTRIAAYTEQFVLSEINAINNLGDNLVYAGQAIKLRKPLYPGVEAEWSSEFGSLNGEDGKEDGLDINIFLMSGTEKIASGVANLRQRLSKLESDILDSFFSKKDILMTRTTPRNRDKLEDFCMYSGAASFESAPMMYIAAAIPAALLELFPKSEIEIANGTKVNTVSGGYMEIDLQFYNQPIFDGFKTIIKKPLPPTNRRGKYFYSFQALCLQEGKPILSGKVKGYTSEEIKI